ncbi:MULTISPECIES: cupin domain-containing protein [Methylococcus]|uniref:Cupin domain-containing protein n=1 Tax=Methylococcus capsulatus TaxID=414 RepID=A0ABZ2F8A7_METCP|nr:MULTISPECIES: cupin domain-containing protein [Methylococcus]MDF9392681.1 cupin domain-containing protein [Methylococcus capsulatus]
MKSRTSWPLLLLAAAAGLDGQAIAAEAAFSRQELLEKGFEPAPPRIDVRVARVVLPVGYKTPLHTHEGPGPRYVVRGRVRVEEGGQSNTYEPGQVFWESGQWMSIENVGENEAEIILIELAKPK